KNGIDCVFLAAPTSTDERVARIAGCSRGFVYVVSRAGVTGERLQLSETALPTVRRVRRHTPLPVAVGFGISKPEHVMAVWEIADGAVVGSAIVAEMEKVGVAAEIPRKAGAFCRWLTGKAY
ncbi:MAG TPA: tryptophan synthase subunit alpha, partial [Acidobacteriota bacterium]|nr:tryptophan synthase subunit alpha [Acidobacteriota bacterium]